MLGGVSMNIKQTPDIVKHYFINGPRAIKTVIANDDYTLTLTFDNNEVRKFDMSKCLFGVFEILKDLNKFKEVFIDKSGNVAWDKDKNIDSSIVWNNRIDLCTDSLYMNSYPLKQ
jgi:hypothetical protein